MVRLTRTLHYPAGHAHHRFIGRVVHLSLTKKREGLRDP
jgi:hypothetical protein